MACANCNETLYIKTIQYCKPITIPLTPEQELKDKLLDLTGECYVPIYTKYCPFCGKLKENGNE